MSAPVKEIRNFKPRLGHVVKNLRFDTILFVSSCHLIPEIPIKKAEFLITMKAIKSLDTILFVSSCHLILEIPVKKAEFLITMRAIKS